jgi:hypothetical protein
MNELNTVEAKRLATEAGPNIDYSFDMTRGPFFPEGRTDIAIMQRDAEDGNSYGRTAWYVVYDNGHGTMIKKLYDTGNINDNCHTWKVEIINGVLRADVSYGNNKPKVEIALSELGL